MASAPPTSSSGRLVWTDPQHRAIEHLGGDLLISAAAGSGKTAVLAQRCARLVCDDQRRCGIDNLLVLTFTDAAAAEMRWRIAQALRARLQDALAPDQLRWLRRQNAMVDRAAISTLHAFCARVLRQHFHEAQVDPAFDVLDQDEANLLQEDILDALLARWHVLPPGDQADAFAEFFEAYAQGRQADCRRFILMLHRMLASTADSAAFLAAARQVYAPGPDGCDHTLRDFIATTMVGKLRIARDTARRFCDEVQALVPASGLLDRLREAHDRLSVAHDDLQTHGLDAWLRVRNKLAEKFSPVKTPKDVPDFQAIKDRTWEKLKTTFKTLCGDFAADPAIMGAELATLARPLETLIALTLDFQSDYTAAKRADNRLDFNDLERLTLDLLKRPGNLAVADLRHHYHHLLVDEFQDINPLQAAILAALRSPMRFDGRGNLFVVGDVKQSIYGFRLAEPALFLERQRQAIEADAAAPSDTPRHIVLPHNFRTHPSLLAVMNGLFERLLTPPVAAIDYLDGHALQPPAGASSAPQSSPSAPVPHADGPLAFEGLPVEVHLVAAKALSRQGDSAENDSPADSPGANSADDPPPSDAPDGSRAGEDLTATHREARMVAARIAQLLQEDRGIRLPDGSMRPLECRDIAILLRTMKDKALIFARALSDQGIPVHAELSTGYFDTREVCDVLALLNVLDNPQQDIPLAAALLGPFGRFTCDDLARIRLAFSRRETPFFSAVMAYRDQGSTALDEGPPRIPDDSGASASSGELDDRLHAFFDRLDRWRCMLRVRPVHEGLAEIYDESGIFAYLAGTDSGDQRIANLQMLHQRALKFAGFRKQGLHRFLRYIEKLSEEGGDLGEAPILSEASNVVRILSIHKAKGLEFPLVLVCGLGSPLRLADGGPVSVHRTLGVGLHVIDVERNTTCPSAATRRISDAQARTARAEELRLLYVAMTRARDALILTGHIEKESELDQWRSAWRGYVDPKGRGLPEDLLLSGRRALDWIMPALSAAAADKTLTVNGRAERGPTPQVVVTVHPPGDNEAAASAPSGPSADILRRILAGEPLPDVSAPQDDVRRALRRVTTPYAYAHAAVQPALQSVTYLKSQAQAPADEFIPPAPSSLGPAHKAPSSAESDTDSTQRQARAQAARDRGIATHRILELLDLTRCHTPEALDAQLATLRDAHVLSQVEIDQADLPGIQWFLLESRAGQRLIVAARRAPADPALRLCREIPFAWLAPHSPLPADPSPPTLASSALTPEHLMDCPTVRGVIDVLLVDTATHSAEIFDYKTDSVATWESHLEEYTRQMRYYLQAATDILGFPVAQATLIFLAPRREIPVSSA